MHWVFHLALVLTLQGFKRLVIHSNIFNALNFFYKQLGQLFYDFYQNPTVALPYTSYPALYRGLALIGLGWPNLILDSASDLQTAATQLYEALVRFTMRVLLIIFVRYDVEPGPSLLNEYEGFLADGSVVTAERAIELANQLLRLAFDPALYIFPACGGALLASAAISWAQRSPKDRCDWALLVSRGCMGLAFGLLGCMDSHYKPDLIDAVTTKADTPLFVEFRRPSDGDLLQRLLQADMMMPMITLYVYHRFPALSETDFVARIQIVDMASCVGVLHHVVCATEIREA